MKKVGVGVKYWLELDGRPLIGKGRYRLLSEVRRTNSLKESAKSVGLSYRAAQNYIKKIEERLGEPIVWTTKGGANAGGSTRLTDAGLLLIKKFEDIRC